MQTEIVVRLKTGVMDAVDALDSLEADYQRTLDQSTVAERVNLAIHRHAFCVDHYGIRVYEGSATIETRGPGRYYAEVGYGNF